MFPLDYWDLYHFTIGVRAAYIPSWHQHAISFIPTSFRGCSFFAIILWGVGILAWAIIPKPTPVSRHKVVGINCFWGIWVFCTNKIFLDTLTISVTIFGTSICVFLFRCIAMGGSCLRWCYMISERDPRISLVFTCWSRHGRTCAYSHSKWLLFFFLRLYWKRC